jgi:colicin import membrane protein
MTARSSSAYFVSALLHGAVVALILFIAYMANQTLPDGPKVFELVAGAGDNYGATEAPALGTPGGIKIDVPEAPAPETPAPAALTPAPVEPVAAPPVEPAPVAPAPVAQDEAPPIAPAPAPNTR